MPDRGARADINGFGPLPKSLLVGACLKNLINPQKSYRADGAESIDSLAAEFKFADQYETALVDVINQKRAGKPITLKSKPAATNVVDLMEALRRSVGKEAALAKAGKPGKKGRKASAGQKEMLMPIEGKKPKEAAAKKPAAKPQRKSA